MPGSDEVRATIASINEAWLEKRPDELTRFFDPDVVFVRPDFGGRLVGRDACVQSFRDFLAQAVVHSFDAGPTDVDVIGPTAVASFTYLMEYEFGGKRWRADGRDLMVFASRDGTWRLIWRWMPSANEEEVIGPPAG